MNIELKKQILPLLIVFLMLFSMFPTQVYAVDMTITTAAIAGITVPVKGETPISSLADTAEYSANISWSPADSIFAADTEYSATITITPKVGYTLTGVTENFFTVEGASSVTNTADSGIVTAIFPKTEADLPEAPEFVSATTNETGNIVTITFDKEMADPSLEAANFDVKINGLQLYYVPVTKSIAISSAALNSDTEKIDLHLSDPLQRGDIVTVDYNLGSVVAADSTTLAAFSAKPVTNIIPVVIDTDLEGTWKIYDHVGNWGEDPFPTGDDPRGNAFNRHIVINGSSVIFYGNGVEPFKDFLFLPSNDTAAKSFTFDLDLSGIKAHSMEGGGFLFNTEINNGLMSGYCTLFEVTEEWDYNTYSYIKYFTANLYQLDKIPVDTFHDGLSPYYNLYALGNGITLLGEYDMPSGNLHSIILEASSNTVDIWDGSNSLVSNFPLPEIYGNGVGIIASYNSHYCNELSYFQWGNLMIQGVADLTATLAGTQANLIFTEPEGSSVVTVEQSVDGINWNPATLTSPITENSTTATVTGLIPNKTYYFRLDITGGLYEGYSRVAIAEYISGPITDLSAVAGNTTVSLTFTPPEGALSLEVMQSDDGGLTWTSSSLKNPITPTSAQANVTGLTNGKKYSFKIIVTQSNEITDDSNIVNSTPKSPSSGGNDRDRTIPESQIPLADLEKVDHFAYIMGYPEGSIKPLNNITREEVAMIFYRLLTDESRNNLQSDANEFKDMAADRWSNRAVSTLYKAGIITGYPDGTFKPLEPITRAEFATIASKFDKLEPVIESLLTDIENHWAQVYINSSKIKGWIKGYEDNTFKPDQAITRAEAITLINNVLGRSVSKENIHMDALKWSDTTETAWYYEAVIEATNSHEYNLDENKKELWIGIKANKVWP